MAEVKSSVRRNDDTKVKEKGQSQKQSETERETDRDLDINRDRERKRRAGGDRWLKHEATSGAQITNYDE